MKIMVLKYLISHKLTFKKQNLYKKFEAYLRIKKQKKPQKTQENKDTLEKTEHTHSSHWDFFFFWGKIIRLKALSY